MPPEVKNMVQDFKDQIFLNPRLKNTVGHILLSFSPKDAPRMTDALMTQIAKEYMQKMGITDTQYLLVRHLDQPHPLHFGQEYQAPQRRGLPGADREIRAVSSAGKDDVRRERLCEPDKARYAIYDAIKLDGKLWEQGIGIRYKYCGNTDLKQNVLFSKNGFVFSGSKL